LKHEKPGRLRRLDTVEKNQKPAANGRRQNANEELRHEEHVNEVNALRVEAVDRRQTTIVCRTVSPGDFVAWTGHEKR
jgi:hypothetical protein